MKKNDNESNAPLWAKIGHIPGMFGIGKDTVNEWRKQGYILCRTTGTSVQVRVSDVNRIMTMEALGLKPRIIDRDLLTKRVKSEFYSSHKA